MFKNNSYLGQACNYSFRDEEDEKQNAGDRYNALTPKNPIMDKLARIEHLMMNQMQLQLENREMLKVQGDQLSKLDSKVSHLYKLLGQKAQPTVATSRLKSTSTKTCRSKKSVDKSLLSSIEERTKVINQEISKRLQDQLDVKSNIEKKPLKFFFTND